MTHSTDTDTRLEQRVLVDLNQPLVLEVHNASGDVTVRAADRADVLIRCDAPGGLGQPGDSEADLIVDARGNRIEIRPNSHPGAGWAGFAADIDLDGIFGQITRAFRLGGPPAAKGAKFHFAAGHGGSADVAIDVPRAMSDHIDVHTASGDVHLEGVSGDIALTTMSGDLRAVRAGGQLRLQTANGDLSVERAAGRLTARTASGEVRVTTSRIEECQLQTANGDVLFDAQLTGDGPYRIQTANGDVRLTLHQPAAAGAEPAATLAFHAVAGDAHVAPPFRKIDRRLWQSGAGGHGPRIDVNAVRGDLTAEITAAEITGDPLPPVPPPPAATDWPGSEHGHVAAAAGAETAATTAHDDVSRLAVLEAVERGEIDVEEALRRLDATDAVAGS